MLKEGIRNSKIPFRILKINRVHFVRHRRGANLSRLRLLRNPVVAYVAPHILRKSYENSIYAPEIIKEFRVGVVRLYLRSHRIQFKFYFTLCIKSLDETLTKLLPIHIRRGNNVRVVIPRRSGKFYENAPCFQLLKLADNARFKH